MTKELTDFFKSYLKVKKKSVKEQNDNESLLSNEKVSVTVKVTELKDFFSKQSMKKKKTQRTKRKRSKKITRVRNFTFLKRKTNRIRKNYKKN